MAVTAQQIVDFLLANPTISDAELAAVMDAYKVTPEQVAQATNTSVAEAQQRYEAVTAPPPPEPVYQPVYQAPVETYYEPVYEPVYQAPVMTNTYFQANPDVAAAYASNSYGMSPDAYADFHWNNYGKNEQRVSPSGVLPTPAPPPVYEAPAAPVSNNQLSAQQIVNLIQQEAKQGGTSTVVDNAETGQTSTVLNNLDGFNATYKPATVEQTEQGVISTSAPELSGFSRVNPDNKDYIQYFDTSGKLVGQEKILSSGQQMWSDLGPIITAAALGGGGSELLGNALGLTGSTAQSVGAGLIKGASSLAGGADIDEALKTGLLTGGLVYGGNALNNYLTTGSTADVGITERQLAIQDAKQLADQGLSTTQIRDTLSSGGYNDAIIDRAITAVTPTATSTSTAVSTPDTVTVTGQAPTSLGNVINTIAGTVPTNTGAVEIVGEKPVNTQDVINAITSNLTTTSNVATTPTNLDTVEVVGNNANTLDLGSVINLINSGNLDTTNLVNNVVDTTKLLDDSGKKKEELTTSDVIRLAGIGTTLAGLNAATQGTDTGTQFPIIPIPEDWKGQPPTVIAPRPRLQPVDFGSRNLLMGTQWEKFLSPTYGQVPAPVQYSQPSNMSYNDLMSILGSKQGYPSSGNLSINDIISGIQNQYGQTPTRTMG